MFHRIFKFAIIIFLYLFTSEAVAENADDINIDNYLLNAMQYYHVPVVGYAIIDHGKIVAAKTLSINSKIKTSTNSLFQAASISKSITAFGALTLVSQGKLNLDEPVNSQLNTWKIPLNSFQKNHPVTLRQILSMTSGLSVSGFAGYPQNVALPTEIDVLEGKAPASSLPITIISQPGSVYAYSGGGFQVLQRLISDVTKKPFIVYMQQQILIPLNMTHTFYSYPLANDLQPYAIPGFLADGTMITGGWENYNIPAAGGLWSTPSDIARFAITASNAYLNKGKSLISANIATEMLTRQANSDYGLGFVVNGEGKNLNFRKAGHNTGYQSELLMFPNANKGVVIMTDLDIGNTLISYMIPIIAKKYHFPCFFPSYDELAVLPT